MDKVVVHEPTTSQDAPPPSPQPTPEQQRAQIVQMIGQHWNSIGDQERTRIAKAKGLLKAEDMADKEKVAAVIKGITLEGDTMVYAKDKDGIPRIAASRLGFICFPKQKGRKKRHLTKTEMAIKSAALRIFRRLFVEISTTIEAQMVAKGEEYFGVPQEIIANIGARAARLGALEVATHSRLARRYVRRQQALSRGINRGTIAGNTPRRNYVQAGGQFGR